MKKFNLNDYILIQIAPDGWGQLERKHGEEFVKYCILPFKEVIDGQDWYKLQAHQVISFFGGLMFHLGGPINSNILIPD